MTVGISLMPNPRSIPKTNWPWLPPRFVLSPTTPNSAPPRRSERHPSSAKEGSHFHNLRRRSNGRMRSRDVGVGLALPGVPHGECGTRRWQAVPLHLAQLDHDVGAGLVPARPVGTADFRAPTRGAPTLWHGRPARDRHGQDGRATIWLRLRRAALPGSAAMYTEGTASRPPTAKGLADIGVQEHARNTLDIF